ncbi:hypothetical protein [Cyanobium sp. LEGE 06113]|uniref:hypothetical protein n=1 Tax=Cyanobium sp. LEGE 06113 TaxID=1297573 RepID=UPI00187EA019|nr:hypothetical protein [Cyanobium sp. LEGE 06113]MBE9153313.1 hypothetical protein [Cyanobium sp. LEGE 06113]
MSVGYIRKMAEKASNSNDLRTAIKIVVKALILHPDWTSLRPYLYQIVSEHRVRLGKLGVMDPWQLVPAKIIDCAMRDPYWVKLVLLNPARSFTVNDPTRYKGLIRSFMSTIDGITIVEGWVSSMDKTFIASLRAIDNLGHSCSLKDAWFYCDPETDERAREQNIQEEAQSYFRVVVYCESIPSFISLSCLLGPSEACLSQNAISASVPSSIASAAEAIIGGFTSNEYIDNVFGPFIARYTKKTQLSLDNRFLSTGTGATSQQPLSQSLLLSKKCLF